jgi:Ca2+-binding EF-hand superfamily protein
MGSCLSLPQEADVWRQWAPLLLTLNFTRSDFRRLLQIFQSMDRDHSGSIVLKELLLYMKMDDSDFMDRAFSLFDDDASGEIDFGEFVVCTWNYCTEDRQSLLMFAFDLYDNDKSGFMSKEELKQLMYDVFGRVTNKFIRSQIVKINASIDKLEVSRKARSGLSFQDFSKLTKSYPSLLSSCYELHRQIQNRYLGVHFWEKLAAKSIFFNGATMSVGEFKNKVSWIFVFGHICAVCVCSFLCLQQLFKELLRSQAVGSAKRQQLNTSVSAAIVNPPSISKPAVNGSNWVSDQNTADISPPNVATDPVRAWGDLMSSERGPSQYNGVELVSEFVSMEASSKKSMPLGRAVSKKRVDIFPETPSLIQPPKSYADFSTKPAATRVSLFESDKTRATLFDSDNVGSVSPFDASSQRRKLDQMLNSTSSSANQKSLQPIMVKKTNDMTQPSASRGSTVQTAPLAHQAAGYAVDQDDNFGWSQMQKVRKEPVQHANNHRSSSKERLVVEDFD